MNFKNIRYPPEDYFLTTKNILKRITEYDIFRYYTKSDFEIGKPFSSPLREDKNPSFSIYYNRRDKLMFRDFGTGDYGDCFRFVQKMYNVDFKESLRIISCDFNLNMGKLSKEEVKSVRPLIGLKPIVRRKSVLEIVPQSFTHTDFMYWKQYGISIDTLLKFRVNSCKQVLVNGNPVAFYRKNNPIYSYTLSSGYKVYRPFSKKYKWFSSKTDSRFDHDIQGMKELPKEGELLVITKSLKDVMVLDTFKIPAIAPHSEIYLIEIENMESLKKRFKRIAVLYDIDKTGYIFSEMLCDMYDLERIFITDEYCIFNKTGKEIKDISDYRKENGTKKTKELLNKILCF